MTAPAPGLATADISSARRNRDGHDWRRSANVLCLCPNHHALFDRGAFTIRDDLTLVAFPGLVGLPGILRTVHGHALNPDPLRHHRERFGMA
jgi:putative restriction endonuclease